MQCGDGGRSFGDNALHFRPVMEAIIADSQLFPSPRLEDDAANAISGLEDAMVASPWCTKKASSVIREFKKDENISSPP
ncbi:hypothetical protein MLD38_003385 [Melastoma candidum]|uniref:Uncharacterized protein n=1 Tax=Melastoma candidum TaxID=119954 RepID=A0ACB9S2F2_9MYRT|nr:hypothetical protein MLD38_003385 [Melastoma candidum]